MFVTWGAIMMHYLAVLIPLAEGGWRAHFPDFPGCRAEGASVEAAIAASRIAVSEQAHRLGSEGASPPSPQSYEDIKANGWGIARGIDWSEAVISLVPVHLPDNVLRIVARGEKQDGV